MTKVIYTICGNPTLNKTKERIENSSSPIILGIPFSDPIAEEPNIQSDSTYALKNGATLKNIFYMLEGCTHHPELIFKTYANVIYSYGKERFISKCKELHISSLIIPDLPYEQREEFLDVCHQYGVHLISIVASNTLSRIPMITKDAKGFIYLSSRPQDDIELAINEIKKHSTLPIIVDTKLDYL